MDLFTMSVTLVAVAIGLVILFVVVRVLVDLMAMLGIRPGFLRALLGFVGGVFALPILVGILRVLLTVISFVDPNSPISTGTVFIFAAFGGLFGWLWGVGSFISDSHEHNGLERLAAIQTGRPVLERIISKGIKGTPGFVRWLLPLLRPLTIALVVSVVVVVIFMVLGMIPSPISRVQTDTPLGSAVTPAGSIILADGVAVNKTVFFVIIAGGALVTLAITAIILALIMGALGRNVIAAKQAPAEPPKTEPALFRLIDFYVSWVGDILEGTKHSISR